MSRYKITDDGKLLYDPAYDHVLKGQANNRLFIEQMIGIMNKQNSYDN